MPVICLISFPLFLFFININVAVFWIFCISVRETKTQLPLFALRKVWGEAVSYICGLKEDYIRLYRGQRAAMYVLKYTYVHVNTRKILTLCLCPFRLSLLRYNTNLTRYKNLLFSHSQQLQAKLSFFKTSIQHDLERYTQQRQIGICEWMLMSHFSV